MREYYHRRAPEYDNWYGGAFYSGDERDSFLVSGPTSNSSSPGSSPPTRSTWPAAPVS